VTALGDHPLVRSQAFDAPLLEPSFLQDRQGMLKIRDCRIMITEGRFKLTELLVGGGKGSSLLKPLRQGDCFLCELQPLRVTALPIAHIGQTQEKVASNPLNLHIVKPVKR